MKMVTINTSEGTCKVPAKWIGEALAVHRPIVGFGGKLSKDRCWWNITHIESGLTAGRFQGPMRDAIKLAKAWDLTFRDELSGPEPDAKGWARKDQWTRQLKQLNQSLRQTHLRLSFRTTHQQHHEHSYLHHHTRLTLA
jgi:hypothetical protein